MKITSVATGPLPVRLVLLLLWFVNAESRIVSSNEVEDWDAPEELKSWFPYYNSGKDDDGSEVFVKEFGKWRFLDLVEKRGKASRVLFDRYYEQYIQRLMKAGEEDGVTVIFDWDGFTLANLQNTEALQLLLRQLTTLQKTERVLKRAYMINTNFAAESLMNLARPLLGTVLEKVEIYGTQKDKWLPKLLKKLPADVIPQRYFSSH